MSPFAKQPFTCCHILLSDFCTCHHYIKIKQKEIEKSISKTVNLSKYIFLFLIVW